MIPKLIALDLDGTTLDSSGRISARTKRAVAMVRDRGIGVIIVTFRAYRSSKPYAVELGLHVPLICVNGALVKDASDDRVLEEFPMPAHASQEAVEYGVKHGHEMCLFVGECYVGSAAVIAKYGTGYAHQWERADDLRTVVAKQSTLMVRYFGDHMFSEARRDLAHLGIEYVDDWLNDTFELTLMRSGVSKHCALARFAEHRGIAREDVLAIGDGALDAGMLKWAGRGVAVANAAPETLAAADEISGSNDDDGVAEILERYAQGDR
ncbi:MAG TPA: Cof-type HAD-IIB family hydrolase [Candidatus Eremiobacteraceae bacterium]|nr:Cof-type HAD-IIB family hydrolase [Candidatus Eremiobacteraceae bacterium]